MHAVTRVWQWNEVLLWKKYLRAHIKTGLFPPYFLDKIQQIGVLA